MSLDGFKRSASSCKPICWFVLRNPSIDPRCVSRGQPFDRAASSAHVRYALTRSFWRPKDVCNCIQCNERLLVECLCRATLLSSSPLPDGIITNALDWPIAGLVSPFAKWPPLGDPPVQLTGYSYHHSFNGASASSTTYRYASSCYRYGRS